MFHLERIVSFRTVPFRALGVYCIFIYGLDFSSKVSGTGYISDVSRVSSRAAGVTASLTSSMGEGADHISKILKTESQYF